MERTTWYECEIMDGETTGNCMPFEGYDIQIDQCMSFPADSMCGFDSQGNEAVLQNEWSSWCVEYQDGTADCETELSPFYPMDTCGGSTSHCLNSQCVQCANDGHCGYGEMCETSGGWPYCFDPAPPEAWV